MDKGEAKAEGGTPAPHGVASCHRTHDLSQTDRQTNCYTTYCTSI